MQAGLSVPIIKISDRTWNDDTIAATLDIVLPQEVSFISDKYTAIKLWNINRNLTMDKLFLSHNYSFLFNFSNHSAHCFFQRFKHNFFNCAEDLLLDLSLYSSAIGRWSIVSLFIINGETIVTNLNWHQKAYKTMSLCVRSKLFSLETIWLIFTWHFCGQKWK